MPSSGTWEDVVIYNVACRIIRDTWRERYKNPKLESRRQLKHGEVPLSRTYIEENE